MNDKTLKLVEDAINALKNAVNDNDGWVTEAEKTIKRLEYLIADAWYENLLWGKEKKDKLNHE